MVGKNEDQVDEEGGLEVEVTTKEAPPADKVISSGFRQDSDEETASDSD